jgi:hypothetical protein
VSRSYAETSARRRAGGKIASRSGIAVALVLVVFFGLTALLLSPRAIAAGWLLALRDDPAGLADKLLERKFDSAVAAREIDAALAENDPELASSLLELARDRNVSVAPDLAERVASANTTAAQAGKAAGNFARGLFVGEPDDLVGLAGTTLGDLFVFGDVRDAVREGAKIAAGEDADQLILGLACVGLAVTAGTYMTAGAGTPARVGLSLAKAAGKTGRIGRGMSHAISRSLREIVDWTALRHAAAGVSLANPAAAVRAARASVKLSKAGDLVRLAGDVGHIQAKAGTRAALDGLKLAESPREMARVAKLAATKGGKTRAILKLLGRSAFALTMATFDLASWLFSALLAVFGFAASAKRAVERITLRRLRKRKARRAQAKAGLALAHAPV